MWSSYYIIIRELKNVEYEIDGALSSLPVGK